MNYTIKTSGIMFKPEMILAYLAGQKNQTRRTKNLKLINENPDDWHLLFTPRGPGIRFVSFAHKRDQAVVKHITMPYGGMGDNLYFQETWKMWEREDGLDFLHYRADDAKVLPTWWTEDDWKRPDPVWAGRFEKWQSSMFMPRICARFRNVQIISVGIERLQDISSLDAMLEGCPMNVEENITPRDWYMELWDKINGKTLPASKNPWVWVYKFPMYTKEG
jgi:hypothetical protein